MKRISTLLAALILCCNAAISHSQVVTRHSHHFYLGYAPASAFRHRGSGGMLFGPVLAGYRYALGKRFTLGAEFGYSYGKTGTYTYQRRESNMLLTLTDQRRYWTYTTTLRLDYHYINRKKVDVYSGLALDGLWTYHRYDVYPVYDYDYGLLSAGLCVAGCRYMLTPKVGVYGEFTFREMGYGMLGLSAKLGK